jgi:integrase/recombinase XerD
MIETLSPFRIVRERHQAAPLLVAREQYLGHLLQRGFRREVVRCTAAYLIHIVRIMQLSELRTVNREEIDAAGKAWAAYDGPLRKKNWKGSAKVFVRIARCWFRFHGQLFSPKPANPFQGLESEFTQAMRARGLAPPTVHGYSFRARTFLCWYGDCHNNLQSVCLRDIDEYLASKRAAGWSLGTIAAACQGLRSFFEYAGIRSWCDPGIALGIRSPRLPKYRAEPTGPTWAEVRRVLACTNGASAGDLRAKAILLLFAIYGLRSSEVIQLRLSDFDWRNETFTVRRAKRGGVQQYPIQYEVGDAIIRYLQGGRPKSSSRHLFVSAYRPHGPIGLAPMWQLVRKRMVAAGLVSGYRGPHSLRHACATRLLRRGASLQEIADFLGHRDIRSIGIYARFDTRSLRKVAAFSLAGVR